MSSLFLALFLSLPLSLSLSLHPLVSVLFAASRAQVLVGFLRFISFLLLLSSFFVIPSPSPNSHRERERERERKVYHSLCDFVLWIPLLSYFICCNFALLLPLFASKEAETILETRKANISMDNLTMQHINRHISLSTCKSWL